MGDMNPLDRQLYEDACDVFQKFYETDPCHLCDCGREQPNEFNEYSHDDSCVLEDVYVNVVDVLYTHWGGRRGVS